MMRKQTLTKEQRTALTELRQKLQLRDEKTVKRLERALNTKEFHIEIKDTTACTLFVLDKNENTVFNVYDLFRIQFTTKQAQKYRDKLLADNRFFEHIYKNKSFISAYAVDEKSFIELCKFCYKVVIESQMTTVVKKEQTEKKAN